ncbi:hypothetical protein M405DRAFT_394754 [Rhizopogon salebrosus TDB-379]|nr:hypothetical protein M405DRAFT_394754 [Rhizopogon salebrosus TDB-379]
MQTSYGDAMVVIGHEYQQLAFIEMPLHSKVDVLLVAPTERDIHNQHHQPFPHRRCTSYSRNPSTSSLTFRHEGWRSLQMLFSLVTSNVSSTHCRRAGRYQRQTTQLFTGPRCQPQGTSSSNPSSVSSQHPPHLLYNSCSTFPSY